MKPDIHAFFASHKLRTTAPRLAVFNTLENSLTPISIIDIIKANPTIDKVSVYRSVDLFVQLGIAATVPYGWKQRYELAAPFRPHHHHSRCTKCGYINEIHSPELEHLIEAMAANHGFRATSHTFEINGLCATCQS